MNFGYDEFGRPLQAHRGGVHETDDEEAHVVKSPQRQPNVLDDSDSDFSDDVEIIDGQAATEDITKPIVAPSQFPHGTDAFNGLLIEDKRVAKDAVVKGFIELIASIPQRQRSIAVIGALHHGKTSLMAMLGSQDAQTVPYQQRKDERARRLTLKTSIATVVLSGASLGPTSSSLVTLVDTPGHPSLAAELAAGVRLVDSALLCVDAAEGVVGHTIHAIRVASLEGLPIALVITKIDRLMLDLRLPPMDMYRKLKGIVDTVNNHVVAMGSKSFVAPTAGTVMFSSSKLNLFFSLETFAQRYVAQSSSRRLSPCALAKKLWGNITFSVDSKSFVKITAPGSAGQRPSFVSFVLEPIYKIVGHAATGSAHTKLSGDLAQRPKGPLAAMIAAVRHYFGDPHTEAVSAVLNCAPQSTKRLSDLLARSRGTDVHGAVAVCPMQRLQTDALSYHVIRVIKGVLRAASACAVMDERSGSDEPYVVSTFSELFIKTPDGLVEVKAAHAGQVVYASCGGGPDRSTGNAVVFQSLDGVISEERDDCYEALNDLVVLPLQCDSPRVLVTIEPVEPRHAATLRNGMHKLARTSPGLDIRAEETGEFTICGFGEVHLDAALNELRSLYCKDVPIKLSAPFVAFAETVGAERGLLAVVGGGGASTHQHMMGVVAGVLQPELVQQLESGAIDPVPSTAGQQHVLQKTLRDVFRWDILEAQRILACGPEASKGTNLLINDLVEEEDFAAAGSSSHRSLQTNQQRSAVVQGFRNAMRAGPLCGEPVRQVKASLTMLSTPPSVAGTSRAIEAQMAIHARQAVTQSLFGARLQLMEPVYAVEMLAVPWRMDAVREILQMRRGIVLSEVPIPATPLNLVKATMPMMDSFGFETQLRMTTVGEVFCSMSFDRWDVVPGDPLDDTDVADPLEPARGFQLARDFVLKTRYRKGLSSDIAVPL